MEKIIRFIIYSIVILAWALVGFLFWSLILFRVTTTFCIAMIISIMSRNNTANMEAQLNYAINFWSHGFKMIFDSMKNDSSQPLPDNYLKFDSTPFWCELFAAISLIASCFIFRPLTEFLYQQFMNILSRNRSIDTRTGMVLLTLVISFIVFIISANAFAVIARSMRKKDSKNKQKNSSFRNNDLNYRDDESDDVRPIFYGRKKP